MMRQGNELLNHLLGGGSDTIFHRSFHGATRHPRCRIRATTVYDMIPELFPDSNDSNPSASRAKRHDCEEADLICAISETTRQDLLRLWSIPPERVVVTHLGVSGVMPSDRDWMRDHGPYLIHVGRRGAYKNFLSLLPSIARTMRGKPVRFLCFGGGPPVEAELATIRELGIEKIVHFVGGSDADLAACYQQAIGHVTASLYEGFGLTPIEAMLYGCPVSCTNRGSLPEVVGAAAHIFDPDSDRAMDDAIRLLLEGKGAHATMINQGRDRAALFDWDRTAAMTMQAYEQAISCRV
jgi:glycosyltransferase involved in cell wall biosynthesis